MPFSISYDCSFTLKVIKEKRHNLSKGRHGEFEPGKAQYSTPKFLTSCFLYERTEAQNLGKAQALGTLPAVAVL